MNAVLKKKNSEIRILNLESLIQSLVIEDVVNAYKLAFFRLMMITKYEKTRGTLEKFYFNSGLTNLKTLWLFKTLHEKETKKIPKAEFLLGSLLNQKKVYEKKNRKDFIVEKFKNIIRAAKTKSTKHLMSFSRDFKNEKERKIKICKIFGAFEKRIFEKSIFDKKKDVFELIKRFADDDLSKKKQGINLLEKIYNNNVFKSRKEGYNSIKKNLEDKKKIENGLKKLLGIKKKNDKKNYKDCYYKIFVYSLEKYRNNIKKTNNYYVGLKKLESFFTVKLLKNNSNVMTTLKDHSKKFNEVYNNYLLKWKLSSNEAKEYMKNKKNNQNNYQSSVKLLTLFLEKQMKIKKNENLKNSFTKILKTAQNTNKQDIIKNTLTLSNFMNLLLKKDKMRKLDSLYKWRENSKEIGSYDYKKILNKNGRSEVKFVYYLKGFERNKKKWIIGFLMLRNILGKIKAKNNGIGFRSIFFYPECFDVLRFLDLLLIEKTLSHKMFFFRRLKYISLEKRKVKDNRFIEKRKRHLRRY